MKNAEIRDIFYTYFGRQGHRRVLSAPLVPAKDPTLLFTNAGMNQFKGVFLQEESRDYRRAVSIQKCMRVSGKHNDFDEVGRTDFHHTFFEMLGNFSFGDYFKEPAIAFAWELLTRHYRLPESRLWVTVFRDDDEAAAIWRDQIGVPSARILRLDEKDNFWQMGETGPCGPCSEIHYDRGPEFGPDGFADGNRRFVEIWNLVFMQFNRTAGGVLQPLPAPSIDTGMGMERLTAVLQGVPSNYGSDLFRPIIVRTAELAGIDAGDPAHRVGLHVIADHARALTFLIGDGVVPANDGRGYVLRRILRRAVKHGKGLGFPGAFLSRVVPAVVETMRPFYPELPPQQEYIARIIGMEEERFQRTLANGLKLFEELLQECLEKKQAEIPGAELFRLSDTYGFPPDFARDLAMEKGLGVDMAGFQRELAAQKERSRLSLQEKRRDLIALEGIHRFQTVFTGYEELQGEAELLAIYADNRPVTELAAGGKGVLVFDRTPFYAESGGQAGDRGSARGDAVFVEIEDVKKVNSGAFLHMVRVKEGRLRPGDRLELQVDAARRRQTAVHHTATHLLHAALREVLGLHVKQAGSYVGPDKLRFDFTHFAALSAEEIARVESLVNEQVRTDLPVQARQSSFDEAVQAGAMAIFEEKYGDTVRVISLGDFSQELCGGTHLHASGEVGAFRITAESSISSGVRRIEALGGEAAWLSIRRDLDKLDALATHFRQKSDQLLDYFKSMESKLRERAKAPAAPAVRAEDLLEGQAAIGSLPVLVRFLEGVDRQQLSELADQVRGRMPGVTVLAANADGRSQVAVAVHKDLTARFNANIIIKQLVTMIHGKGGGRADFAQGGGDPISSPDDFVRQAHELLRSIHG